VDGGHAALVVELLKRGADVALKDSQGDTALDYAELCEYEELAALLVGECVPLWWCLWVSALCMRHLSADLGIDDEHLIDTTYRQNHTHTHTHTIAASRRGASSLT